MKEVENVESDVDLLTLSPKLRFPSVYYPHVQCVVTS